MFLTHKLYRPSAKLIQNVNKLILNDSIPFETVRVLKDRKFLGDFSLLDAINAAKSHNQHLILFKAKANPPICVIDTIDSYNSTFNDESASEQNSSDYMFDPCSKLKQVHISNMCSDTDFERKIKQARKFLISGYRVNIALVTKGGPSAIKKSTKVETKDLYPTKIHYEAERNIIKNADKLAAVVKEKGMDLAYSTENPLIIRIDKIYSLLHDVGKPFTVKSKIVSASANQRQIVVKFFPTSKASDKN